MLGVTAGRGNSVSEILAGLRRSVKADDSIPAASFYFSKTSDIRSTTRDNWFDAAVAKLRENGRHALVVKTDLPRFRRDIGGLMTGTAGIDWKKAQCVITPGAICEHLTSFGGIMSDDATQTPISEWIRYGASGTSARCSSRMRSNRNFRRHFSMSIMLRGIRWQNHFIYRCNRLISY